MFPYYLFDIQNHFISPAKKKKKFIDKKHAVTFHLVHRSQKDPLQADDEAPQHILLPEASSEKETKETRKEEQRVYGVYFDDDYDYMQHLKDVGEINQVGMVSAASVRKSSASQNEPKLKLPSSVFASGVETEVGLLNKAAPISGPRPDLDPDILAALDDDFDLNNPENQLEDNIMEYLGEELSTGEQYQDEQPPNRFLEEWARDQACEFGLVEQEDFDSDEAEYSSEDNMSDRGSLGDRPFMDEETKSRFTEYSMTSSVLKRNEGLTFIDDKFEKLYEQYDEEEIGALDHEDIAGHLHKGSQLLEDVMSDFQKTQEEIKLRDAVQKAEDIEVGETDEDEDEDDIIKMVVEEPQEKWDCESILSTYSSLYNHPKTIDEPKKPKPVTLTNKTQLPVDDLSHRGLTRRQIEAEMRKQNKANMASTQRRKDETPEEKKARKKAVQEERKVRREEKKLNKTVFKGEELRQHNELLNIQKNMQGIKIT